MQSMLLPNNSHIVFEAHNSSMIRLTSLPLLPLRGASGHVCLRCRVAAYSRVSTRPGSITLPTARHGIRAASSKAKPKAKPASARPKAAAKQDVKRKRSSAAKSGAAKKHATKQQPAQTPWPLPLRKEKPLQKPIGATIGSMGRSLEAALSRNKPGLPSASKSIEADALAIESESHLVLREAEGANEFVAIPAPRPPVPSLAHGLDRVLFKSVALLSISSTETKRIQPRNHALQGPSQRRL